MVVRNVALGRFRLYQAGCVVRSGNVMRETVSYEGARMRKVLIVEDDLMIADMTDDVLVAHGYEVCGIARTLAQGVALGRYHEPELAIIDVRLADGDSGIQVARQLSAFNRLAILYVTGNASSIMAGAVGHGCLLKPYRFADLLRSLEIVVELNDTGKATLPFPEGFRTLPGALVGPVERAHA